jgi:hypothetical protein
LSARRIFHRFAHVGLIGLAKELGALSQIGQAEISFELGGADFWDLVKELFEGVCP